MIFKQIVAGAFGLFTCLFLNAQSIGLSNTIPIDPTDNQDLIVLKAAHVVPTKNQLDALEDEFIAFIHFGPNTFTRKEWGNGMEDPSIFDLQNLDTDQWCEAIRSAGMTKIIITAKHHDGFVLWQSRYTEHGVMSSPFKKGKGDILKELAASCKKYGLKLGVYLSPADLFQIESAEGLYGNLSSYSDREIPRPVEGRPFENKTTFTFHVDDYNEYFLNQLFEVLTEYGPVHEVWFDGAHPKRKGGQTYNYMAWKELIRTLVPNAVIFGREDIRWCGNESGATRSSEWNVIPYKEDPHKMSHFADLTNKILGERSVLDYGSYLHYQPAETNTSIRAGWFYRDDSHQSVRNADDVFDMYERSVGGNSIFLLNIPPNREGKLSPRDVEVLRKVGQRIRDTYGNNLLTKASGPKEVLDQNNQTYITLDEMQSFEIKTPEPITCNRLVLQEAILTHSERVEKFEVQAWINGAWEHVANSTNIGYKRILRFPKIETDKIRITILEQRHHPAIANITAHYYKAAPPLLTVSRNPEGMVQIIPKMNAFSWKPHDENFMQNINVGFEIRYSLDGSVPDQNALLYEEGFFLSQGEVNARALTEGKYGGISQRHFGLIPKQWKIKVCSEISEHEKIYSTDTDPSTYWQSIEGPVESLFFELDLTEVHQINGFFYTPQNAHDQGMIEKGRITLSQDGGQWTEAGIFEFGNLINDPSRRSYFLAETMKARYIRIEPIQIAGNSRSMAIAEIEIF